MGWGVTRSTTSPRRTATSLASKSASLILACLFVRVVLYDYLIDAGVCRNQRIQLVGQQQSAMATFNLFGMIAKHDKVTHLPAASC